MKKVSMTSDKTPVVTCIIMVYRNFDYLKDTVNSVLIQNYPHIEVIINDDGSENFDRKFVESLFENKPANIVNLIIHHNEVNLGITKSYNNAVNMSRGEYFIHIAGDDVFHDESVITDLIHFFQKNRSLLVTCKRAIYDENMEKYIQTGPPDGELFFLKNNLILYRRLCFGSPFFGACTYFSKQFIETYGGFDESYKLYEDNPKYMAVVRQNCKIDYFDRITIKYRQGGISHLGKTNPILEADRELLRVKEILPNIHFTGFAIHLLAKYNLLNKIRVNPLLTKLVFLFVFPLNITFPLILYKVKKRLTSLMK